MFFRGCDIPTKLFDLTIHHKEASPLFFSVEELEELGVCAIKYAGFIPTNVEISLLIVDDLFIKKLNYEYRGIDKPTNVLSFDGDIPTLENTSNGEECLLGSIVISYDTLKREAIEQNKTIKDHFYHLIVHSILHLLGYDHEKSMDEQVEMECIEVKILECFNINNPY